MRVFLSPLTLRRDSRRTGHGAQSRSRGVRRRSVVVDAEHLEGRRLLAAAAAVAPPVPLGPEFAVNSHTANSQELFPESPCAVAAAADGSFVVTWSSSGQDGSSWGVYAQRFDSGGAPDRGEENQQRSFDHLFDQCCFRSQSNIGPRVPRFRPPFLHRAV